MGLLLELASASLLLPILAAMYYKEDPSVFLWTMAFCLALGVLLDKRFEKGQLSLGDGLALSAISFVFLALVAGVPYYNYINEGSLVERVVSCFFEGLSGVTTTGLSVFPSVESLPRSVLLWRATTQWLGGAGIIIVFLSVISGLRTSGLVLYTSQGYTDKIDPTVRSTSLSILKVYVFYTGVYILLLWLVGGLPLFHATSVVFSGISTGGFTVVDSFYESPVVRAITCLVMLTGGINFLLHTRLFRGGVKSFFSNPEIRSMTAMALVAGLVIGGLTGSLGTGFFEAISAVTATGYSVVPQDSLPSLALLLVIVLMIVGSSSGSTAGGIKQLRAILSIKAVWWTVRKTAAPSRAVIPLKLGGKPVKTDTVVSVLGVVVAYLALWGLGTITLTGVGYDPVHAAFQAASAQGTVGLDIIGVANSTLATKLVLMCLMLLGRLEILPLLVLIARRMESW